VVIADDRGVLRRHDGRLVAHQLLNEPQVEGLLVEDAAVV
jgi:hypothetical protein